MTWAPQAPPAAPGTWQPGQAPTTVARTSGCLRFGLGITILGCLGLIAVLILAVVVVSNLLGFGLFGLFGTASEGGGLDDPCPFLTDQRARELFGGQADAVALTGLYEATIGVVLDDRVLPDASDCWVSGGTRSYAARLAVHQGADASAVFDRERQNAEPQTEDQGNGVTVTREGYFGGDVAGLGDRAFCTGPTLAGLAGVLVQRGDRVVYASVGQADPNVPPVFQPGTNGGVTAPEQCSFAQEVARAILG